MRYQFETTYVIIQQHPRAIQRWIFVPMTNLFLFIVDVVVDHSARQFGGSTRRSNN